jgi:hypothetical protein
MSSAQADETEQGHDDDNCANDINDLIHGALFRLNMACQLPDRRIWPRNSEMRRSVCMACTGRSRMGLGGPEPTFVGTGCGDSSELTAPQVERATQPFTRYEQNGPARDTNYRGDILRLVDSDYGVGLVGGRTGIYLLPLNSVPTRNRQITKPYVQTWPDMIFPCQETFLDWPERRPACLSGPGHGHRSGYGGCPLRNSLCSRTCHGTICPSSP